LHTVIEKPTPELNNTPVQDMICYDFASKPEIVKCDYIGCSWLGEKKFKASHLDRCEYGNLKGPQLLELLKSTDFENTFSSKVPDIKKTITPLFESRKLAAIDFEVKDIQNTSMTASQSSTADLTELIKLATILERKHPDDIDHKEYNYFYENDWTVYESGTASALDEIISVKVTAFIKQGYQLGMEYSINFHQRKREFKLGHLLLDGSEAAAGVIPDSFITDISKIGNSGAIYRNGPRVSFSTPNCQIRFQGVDPIVQLILGRRRIGFRLFLFDTPPKNADIKSSLNSRPVSPTFF